MASPGRPKPKMSVPRAKSYQGASGTPAKGNCIAKPERCEALDPPSWFAVDSMLASTGSIEPMRAGQGL